MIEFIHELDLVNWGIAGVMIAYVLWRDYDREKTSRQRDLEQREFIQNTLLEAIKENTRALQGLNSKPCLWETRK